jgi:hypothetical protein
MPHCESRAAAVFRSHYVMCQPIDNFFACDEMVPGDGFPPTQTAEKPTLEIRLEAQAGDAQPGDTHDIQGTLLRWHRGCHIRDPCLRPSFLCHV